jgi:hypothetical protein
MKQRISLILDLELDVSVRVRGADSEVAVNVERIEVGSVAAKEPEEVFEEEPEAEVALPPDPPVVTLADLQGKDLENLILDEHRRAGVAVDSVGNLDAAQGLTEKDIEPLDAPIPEMTAIREVVFTLVDREVAEKILAEVQDLPEARRLDKAVSLAEEHLKAERDAERANNPPVTSVPQEQSESLAATTLMMQHNHRAHPAALKMHNRIQGAIRRALNTRDLSPQTSPSPGRSTLPPFRKG